MIEAGLIAARFLHFASVLVLFGLAVFPLYTYHGRVGPPPARLSRWLRTRLRLAALLALLSGIAWGYLTVANMTGSLISVADSDALWAVFRETGFGQVWIARLALIVTLLASDRGCKSSGHPDWITAGVSGTILAALAAVGHTHISDGAAYLLHLTADGAHLLAAGAWLGGLLPLAFLLALARRSPSPEHCRGASVALLRFSGIGYTAVAVLVVSGLVNTCFLVGSVGALAGSPYGQLVLAKLCLLVGMLALAGLNRFWLVPSLISTKSPGRPADLFVRLRRHVLAEQAVGLTVVFIVSVLGMMQPAINS